MTPVLRRATGIVTALLLASACTSTTREDLDVNAMLDAPSVPAATAAGTDAESGSATFDPTTGGTLPAGSAPRSAATGRGGGGSGAPSSSPGASTPPAPEKEPTGEPVRIGVHYSEDLAAAYGALGASNAEPDVVTLIPAIIDWVNAHGGLAGHPVEAIIHGSDPLDGTFDSQSQAACEEFDDQGVFAVVSGAVMPSIVLPDCLSKRGIPFVWNYHYLVDEATWKQYRPFLYMPFSINADRLGPVYVNGLAEGGWFEDAKVGIVRYDNPQHTRFTKTSLRPALDAIGAEVVEEVALSQPGSAAAAGDTATQISAGILRLRSAGATHVLFVPTGGAVPFIFMTEAENQGFRPRYGMNTLDIPYFVNDQANAAQLHGALAVGWSPASDVYKPDEPSSPRRELCYELTDGYRAPQRFCDAVFFLKDALDRAPSFDVAGLRASVETMGESFDPVFSLRTFFGPGRHDGASATRLVAFVDECECFRYTGELRSIG